jgi:hypothetical protein
MGSVFVARRAGIKHANIAMIINNNAIRFDTVAH